MSRKTLPEKRKKTRIAEVTDRTDYVSGWKSTVAKRLKRLFPEGHFCRTVGTVIGDAPCHVVGALPPDGRSLMILLMDHRKRDVLPDGGLTSERLRFARKQLESGGIWGIASEDDDVDRILDEGRSDEYRQEMLALVMRWQQHQIDLKMEKIHARRSRGAKNANARFRPKIVVPPRTHNRLET